MYIHESRSIQMAEGLSQEPCMIFRLNDDGSAPELVKEAFYERGWVEYDEYIHSESQWNLWWKTSRFRTSDYNQLYPWQRVNHCPKATGITRKDCLARLLKLQHSLHGSAYSFAPHSYILPNDYRKFTQEFSYQKDNTKGKTPCWICKPADLSRGRGIVIIRELAELQYDTNTIVQQYITDPLLIHGHKFDIRLYVAVMSYHPLTIYLYNDGIVRFSCEKYDLYSLSNLYSHLTNTSINKYSSAYNVDKTGIGHGSKWTIKQLRHYFHQRHVDDQTLWWQILLIINLTIIPQVSEVPHTNNCFELYGFDILVDSNMKPWLLEVNFSPSLSNDCSADNIKKEMLSDLLDLMEFRSEDAFHGAEPMRQRIEPVRGAPSRLLASRQSKASRYRRPQSMVTRLPQLANTHTTMQQRFCVSANESSEPCLSEEEEEVPNDNANNILTCSLSQLNLPPSSLVNHSTVSPLNRQLTVRSHSNLSCYDTRTPASMGSPASLGSPAGASSSRLSRRSNVRVNCYTKPWRQGSESVKIQRISSSERNTVAGTKTIVGGFYRTYPFSTLTSTKHLSPRQMVIESHQMIRSKIADHRSSKTNGATSNRRQSRSINTNITMPFPPLGT